MELLRFLDENTDWEKKLSQKPYSLTVKTNEPYVLFIYSQIHTDFSFPLCQESRGIILKKITSDGKTFYRIVCRPFDKFFNLGEKHCVDIDWSTAKICEKLDGSLIKIWYDSTWHVSSMRMVDISGDLGDLFFRTIKDIENFWSRFDPEYTYLFELTSPENQIVVPYPETKLYHLATRHTLSGKEVDVDIGFAKPTQYTFESMKDCFEFAQTLPWTREGFVVSDALGRRVKVKGKSYVNAHHLRTEKTPCAILLAEERDEILAYFPEIKETPEYKKYQELVRKVEKDLRDSQPYRDKSRKEFAEWAKDKTYPVILFASLETPIEDVDTYFRTRLTESKLKQLLRIP